MRRLVSSPRSGGRGLRRRGRTFGVVTVSGRPPAPATRSPRPAGVRIDACGARRRGISGAKRDAPTTCGKRREVSPQRAASQRSSQNGRRRPERQQPKAGIWLESACAKHSLVLPRTHIFATQTVRRPVSSTGVRKSVVGALSRLPRAALLALRTRLAELLAPDVSIPWRACRKWSI
jgi:hypothetical protein